MEIDWKEVSAEVDERGNAVVERLLSPAQCCALAALYEEERPFRSRVVMARHGFGRGEYKYFGYPLPEVLAALKGGSVKIAVLMLRRGVDRRIDRPVVS